MTSSVREISETSPAFREALLKSERKRIFAVVSFALFFALLAPCGFSCLARRWGASAFSLHLS
jgi:hypothetical protein